jgi:histidinol-phosphate phosphatase family protein
MYNRISQAVILAGGKGTRLENIGINIPKILIQANGKSLLENHFEELIKNNINNVILLLGHKADDVIRYLTTIIVKYRSDINCESIIESSPNGTKNALLSIKNKLDGNFLLINGDLFHNNYVTGILNKLNNVDFKEYDAIFSTRYTDHPEDSDLIVEDLNHRITDFSSKNDDNRLPLQSIALSGMSIINPKLLNDKYLMNGENDFITSLLSKENLTRFNFFSANNNRLIMDLGTSNRIQKFNSLKSLNLLKPALFIDRDGTLIEMVEYIKNTKDVKLKKDVDRVLQYYKNKDFFLISVSNTPQIARGLTDLKTIYAINNEIQNQVNQFGVKIDAFYICPHHPDKGFLGEVSKYKIICTCRKPSTGMISRACEEFPIDLKNSIVIGDSWRDIELGRQLGLKTIQISENYSDMKSVPTKFFTTFLEYMEDLNH